MGCRYIGMATQTAQRVLVVEDSEEDAVLLRRELRRGGYCPHDVRVDRPNALQEALERQEWDVVLADHRMPGFDSSQALEIFKAARLDIPFIIVSGSIGEVRLSPSAT